MVKVIVVEDLWKTYRSRKLVIQVLRGISFNVENKTVTCIIGPNGAGKTTLLKIIAGFIEADRGKVLVLGKSPRDASIRRRVGYMPQEDVLFDSLTFAEHLELLKNTREGIRVDLEFVYNLLEKVRLNKVLQLNIGKLSGGQRRLVQMFLAISHKPEIILLDEPIAFVDKENRETILEVIRKLVDENGSTILIASHDPYACSIANRVLELRDGLIKEVKV